MSGPVSPAFPQTPTPGPSPVPEAPTPVAVELRGLTKLYGRHAALDGVDLTVPAGAIFGFLGPNGAGKTTTLRILGGLARPSAGSAAVLGHDVQRATNEVRSLIGFLPDVPGFYPWMTAPEFLRFAGRLFGIEPQTLETRVAALLDLAGLRGVEARVGTFSRGMKQRLGVAQALVNAPRLLLLDEPTSALDPIGRKEVLDMIAALAGRTTVFFSTHILAAVARVCATLARLDRVRRVEQASIAAPACRSRRPHAPSPGARLATLGRSDRTRRRHPASDGGRPGGGRTGAARRDRRGRSRAAPSRSRRGEPRRGLRRARRGAPLVSGALAGLRDTEQRS